jgi:hypothetical protein
MADDAFGSEFFSFYESDGGAEGSLYTGGVERRPIVMRLMFAVEPSRFTATYDQQKKIQINL